MMTSNPDAIKRLAIATTVDTLLTCHKYGVPVGDVLADAWAEYVADCKEAKTTPMRPPVEVDVLVGNRVSVTVQPNYVWVTVEPLGDEEPAPEEEHEHDATGDH